MRNTFKNSWKFIIILFVSIILPFNVEAKQTNTFIRESKSKDAEIISGDTFSMEKYVFFTPLEEHDFELYDEDNVTKVEYYIIDSIDSKGNIKYKKYDFSKSPKSVWEPKISAFYTYSGLSYEHFSYISNANYYNSCIDDTTMYGEEAWDGMCNVFLPAINGKISRWRLDSKENENKKVVDVCNCRNLNGVRACYSCDKTDDASKNTYVGTYEFYTSTIYKFYELPDEKPRRKITCDSNKLSAGETTKCKINFSYKYGLSSILFDITSEKFKINNFEINDYWEDNPYHDMDYSKYWTYEEINNGYSVNFTYDYWDIIDSSFKENPVIATFEITADEDIDDVVDSIEKSDIKYIDKTGDGISNGEEPIVDDNTNSDNNTNNILNPSTFRNSYYLIIGIIIIGGICFIQLKSKKKSK